MPDPPYKEFDYRSFTHSHIIDMLHTALKASGSPSLAAVNFEAVDPKWVSGDVDVYTTHRDRERVVKYAHLWFPHLIQGEFARIPKEYYPKPQTPKPRIEAPIAQDPMESTPLPTGHTPSEDLRRKSNGSKRNLEDISVNSQSNLSRQQSRRDKRKRKKIRKQQRKQEEQENQAPVMTGFACQVSY
jgi:hypothetical protein